MKSDNALNLDHARAWNKGKKESIAFALLTIIIVTVIIGASSAICTKTESGR